MEITGPRGTKAFLAVTRLAFEDLPGARGITGTRWEPGPVIRPCLATTTVSRYDDRSTMNAILQFTL